MDRFLEQKKKADDLESEAQHVLSQNTKKQKLQTSDDEYIKLSGFIECLSDVVKQDSLCL